jgi:hypothetical protein
MSLKTSSNVDSLLKHDPTSVKREMAFFELGSSSMPRLSRLCDSLETPINNAFCLANSCCVDAREPNFIICCLVMISSSTILDAVRLCLRYDDVPVCFEKELGT